MDDSQLPVDLAHWALAAVPVLVLLLLLAVWRWRAPEAGAVGMFAAALVAMLAFRTPAETAAVAGAKGVWDALFILYVIWPALLLYRLMERAGAFHGIRCGIERFSRNELYRVLAFGWVFASFVQGVAGFGAPIAVVAPLLVAIGVRPLYAVAVPLIGHAWATMFGTLGVGWIATLQVVDLADESQTALRTAILLVVPILAAGITIAWMYGGLAAVRHAWPLVLGIGAIQGGVQIALTLWDPVLAGFLAAAAALAALHPFSRWSRFSEPAEGLERSRIMEEDGGEAEDGDGEPEPVMSLRSAMIPYAVLTVVSVGSLAIPPVEAALGGLEVGLPFAAVRTGYDLTVPAEQPYSPFAPLTHPGTFLLVAAAAAWLLFRARGCFAAWREHADERSLWGVVAEDALPASVAVVAFLVMSKLMDHSGQVEVLALGVAAAAPPMVYAFAANGIGVLGAFMTSSNTASNILFAPLHQEAVAAMSGVSEPTIIAAQSAGGAIGNVVAPANVVLGTGPAGITGREGDVLRKTLPWAAAVSALTGGATLLLDRLPIP